MADLMINVSPLLTFACAYDIIDHTIRPRIPWRYVAVTVARGYLYVDKTAGQKESEVFMKKVLLLGDSIRMGYQSEVKKLLENEYEVMYPEFCKHHTPEVLKEKEIDHALKELAEIYTEFEAIYEEKDKYPDKLLSALCNNPEMLSYVEGYLKYERKI